MLGRPWRGYRLVLRLVRRWVAVTRDALRLRRHSPPDAVLVGYLGHFDVILARVLFPRTTVVLDMLIFAADTARDRRATGRLMLLALAALDRLAASCATIVIVDTEEHLALIPRRHRRKGLVVAVGTSDTWFRDDPVPARDPEMPLRVVFFGLFTPLQGADVIGSALGLLAHDDRIATTMIGRGQDLARTREHASENQHVTWVDWLDEASLRETVLQHDVCLGIFGTSPKALRVVPNKVFQGAAAGSAIVTSDTPAQRRALGENAVFVPPGDPRSLADAVRALGEDPSRLAALRTGALEHAERHFRPAQVVEPFRAALLSRVERRAGSPRDRPDTD